MIFQIGEISIEFDLLEVERAFVALEREAGVKDSKPTIELLDALVEWLAAKGIAATRSGAWQVWWGVYERIDKIRKGNRVNAEIAFWFHCNPFELTTEQRVALMANLPRVQAQGTLQSGSYNGTDYNYIYRLTLLATGDKQAANRAKADALERYVDAKMGTR